MFKKKISCKVTLTEALFPKNLIFPEALISPFISVNKMRPLRSLFRLLTFIRQSYLIAVLMCYEPVLKQIDNLKGMKREKKKKQA